MWKKMLQGKGKNGVTVAIGIVLSFLGIILIGDQDVWARKCVCGNKDQGYDRVGNYSISHACSELDKAGNWGMAQGVMWISDNPDEYSISSTVTVNDLSQETITVYLHGAVINGSTHNSGGAKHIRLVKDTQTISNNCDSPNCVNYEPFGNSVPDTMDRTEMYYCDTNNDFRSEVKSITLNVKEMTELETAKVVGNKTVYEVPIEAFRCHVDATYGTNRCFSSSSELYVTITNPNIDVTLTSHAIDKDGGATLKSQCDARSASIRQGESQDVTVGGCQGQVPSNYVFVCWRDTPSGSCVGNNEASFNKSISADDDVYAVYETSEYEGRSRIIGGTGARAGYTTGTASDSSEVNCSAVAGCSVTFDHYLKRTKGSRSVKYYVSRTSNLQSVVSNNSTLVSESEWSGDGGEFKVGEESLTLYPGMVVCETLYFKPTLFSNRDWSYTKVCASAVGNAQPDDPPGSDDLNPEGDSSFLNIKVRNDAISTGYKKEVYAKPGDNLTFKAVYNPNLQYTYYLIPQGMRIGGRNYVANDGLTQLGTLFNGWKNAFSIHLRDSNDRFISATSHVYSNGLTTRQSPEEDEKVDSDDVGKVIIGEAKTNGMPGTQTTPSQVSFSMEGNLNVADVITTQISATALAKIPYNFINTATIKDDGKDKIAFAGEDSSALFKISLMPKYNALTMNAGDKNYATKVDGARKGIQISINDTSWGSDPDVMEEMGTLEPANSPTTTKEIDDQAISFVTPDLPAGTEIWIRVGVYPSNSGGDNNLDKEGSGEWAWSNAVKYTIAKRPSVQVLGGNIFSAGKIDAAFSVKRAFGDGGIDGNLHVFGSWGELGLTALGAVKGFASGASLSSGSNGSNESDLCELSWLTISNVCEGRGKDAIVGKAQAKSSIAGIDIDKGTINSLIDEVKSTDKKREAAEFNNISDGEILYYYNNNGNITINGSEDTNTISRNTIKVVEASGDIMINSNIHYANESYASLKEVPKVIFYAKGDIIIDCGVGRIDAVLMANNVKTCNSGNQNSKLNSNQLTIYGAVIANKLILNRTYGAATGENSNKPAEIINFDPSLYLWGGSSAGSEDEEESVEIHSVYVRELAPRY